MAKFKNTTKSVATPRKTVILATSIVALTTVGVGAYWLTSRNKTKPTTSSNQVPKTSDTEVNKSPSELEDIIDIDTLERGMFDKTGYEFPEIEDEKKTPTEGGKTEDDETEDGPEMMTDDEGNTFEILEGDVSDLTRLDLASMKAVQRAYNEYKKDVRDPRPGTLLDKSGDLYNCRYRKIGTFPQGVRIFSYLKHGVKNNQDYYSNPSDGSNSCGVYEYQWCGAFVAYCWIDVKPSIRKKYFPSVTRLMTWAEENPDRVIIKRSEVMPGDIFLIAKAGARRGRHIALCYEDLGYGVFTTIEGNTRGDGQKEGVCMRTRYSKKSPHRPDGEDFIIKVLRPVESDLMKDSDA